MSFIEPDTQSLVAEIHDHVAVYVKQLDDFMRDLSPDQARELATDARRLLTVATFLRDATVDLLESAGIQANDVDGEVEDGA